MFKNNVSVILIQCLTECKDNKNRFEFLSKQMFFLFLWHEKCLTLIDFVIRR